MGGDPLVRDAVKQVAEAIHGNFTSPNEADANLEAANVVDGLFAVARSLAEIADAIRESNGIAVKR